MTAAAGRYGSGILLYSGGFLAVDGRAAPTLQDVAHSLARLPRFAGHTRVPWTVLDHSLFCHFLACSDGQPCAVRLACLLHDAHEAVTGDVPTPYKTASMRTVQEALDERILGAHYPGGYAEYRRHVDAVKAVDRRALLTEALLVGPPALKCARDVYVYFGAAPEPRDVDLFQSWKETRPGRSAQQCFQSAYRIETGPGR